MSIAPLLARLWKVAFSYETWNFGTAKPDMDAMVVQGRLGPVRWANLGNLFGLRADPVFWNQDGQLRILYEELHAYRGRGEIRSIAVDDMDGGGRSRAEIRPPYHVSYPQLLREEGTLFCTVESAVARGVDLYAWDGEKLRWRLAERLLDRHPVLDPTIVRWNGQWYLFGTMVHDDCGDRELYLWGADRLRGPWQAHPRSPIQIPSPTARCGGAFFVHAGRLYRPSQDAAGGYGSAVCINRVEVLNAREYFETEVCRLRPDPTGPFPEGLHTLAIYGDMVVIDGKRRRWHPLAWLSKIIWHLRGAPKARIKLKT